MGEALKTAAERLRPLFAQIARGGVEREGGHELPRDEVRALAEAGFGALRVPVAFGGAGLAIPQAVELWIELAAADSNLPQIFRGQIAYVEDRLQRHDERWLRRFAAGDFVGNAWSETGGTTTKGASTRLVRTERGPVLRGRKYYTTGSIYAQWTDVTATAEDGTAVTAVVRTDAPGLSISDDWDGFGQQLTGTGTIVFDDVPVDEANIASFDDRFTYQTALYQLVLLSVLAGVARRAADDVAQQVRQRTRVYTHGLAPLARHDGQILQVVGQVDSAAFASRAVVLAAAEAVQRAADVEDERGSERHRAIAVEAELATARAQSVLSELVPAAATRLFNALGASATSHAKDLDRHWRNARTVASHNPVVYKERIVGDWVVNGAEPPFIWDVGRDPETRADALAGDGAAQTETETGR